MVSLENSRIKRSHEKNRIKALYMRPCLLWYSTNETAGECKTVVEHRKETCMEGRFRSSKPPQIGSQFNTSPYRASYYEFCFRVKLWKTWAKVNFLRSIHCVPLSSSFSFAFKGSFKAYPLPVTNQLFPSAFSVTRTVASPLRPAIEVFLFLPPLKAMAYSLASALSERVSCATAATVTCVLWNENFARPL